MDRFPQGNYDAIDERLHPDLRFTPSSDAILSQRLYSTPLFILVKNGSNHEVILGKLSEDDIDRIVRSVSRT